jgi:hypothetical protein
MEGRIKGIIMKSIYVINLQNRNYSFNTYIPLQGTIQCLRQIYRSINTFLPANASLNWLNNVSSFFVIPAIHRE